MRANHNANVQSILDTKFPIETKIKELDKLYADTVHQPNLFHATATALVWSDMEKKQLIRKLNDNGGEE